MGTPNNLGFLAIIKINSGIAGRRSDALPGVRASPDKLVPAGIEEIRAALRGTGDLILAKPRLGAFHGTELEIILQAASIDTLLIGGIATNMCVETTAREAAVRDFRVLFLRDGTATFALPDAGLGPASEAEVQRVTCNTIAFGFGEVLDVQDVIERLESTTPISSASAGSVASASDK